MANWAGAPPASKHVLATNFTERRTKMHEHLSFGGAESFGYILAETETKAETRFFGRNRPKPKPKPKFRSVTSL